MTVAISRQHKAIVLKYRKDVMNVMPHARTDGTNIIVPHGREETKLLRNLGIDVPAPILYQYDWGNTKPFDNQKDTAALLSMNPRVFVLSEMGVGKTRATIFAIDYLLRTGEAKNVLVVAPLSTLNPTWRQEFLRVMPLEKTELLHGTKAQRIARLKTPGCRIFLINHDGIEVLASVLSQCAFDIVVVDELIAYRNPRTNRWKALNPITQRAKFVWGLTGAPTPNSPLDAYGQIKLLTPGRVGRYTHFRDDLMRQLTTFLWVPKPDAYDKLHALMQPSVRFKLRDCHDLPETTFVTRSPPLSKTQDRFYDAVFRHALAQYKQHQITAANEGVKLLKLLQISAGYVKTAEGKTLGLGPKARLDELTEILRECEHKAIVFVPFINALKQVYNHVLKTHSARLVYGEISRKERDLIFHEFQHSPDPRVIVAQPDAMQYGLNLTRANLVVWWSPTNDLDTYVQANARIIRAGQDKKTMVLHLESTKVEKKTYARLRNKERVQGSLLELFEGVDDA